MYPACLELGTAPGTCGVRSVEEMTERMSDCSSRPEHPGTLKALLTRLSVFWTMMENSSSLEPMVLGSTWWVKVRASVEMPWALP